MIGTRPIYSFFPIEKCDKIIKRSSQSCRASISLLSPCVLIVSNLVFWHFSVNFFTVLLNDFDVIKKHKIRAVIIQLIRPSTKKKIIVYFIFCLFLDNFFQNSKEKMGFEIFLWIYRTLIWWLVINKFFFSWTLFFLV